MPADIRLKRHHGTATAGREPWGNTRIEIDAVRLYYGALEILWHPKITGRVRPPSGCPVTPHLGHRGDAPLLQFRCVGIRGVRTGGRRGSSSPPSEKAVLVAAGCRELRVGSRTPCNQNPALPKIFSLLLETYLELPGTYLVDASISSAIKRVNSETSPWTEALSNAAM